MTWRQPPRSPVSHALVVGAACAGAQPGGALLRPVRQGLRRQQRCPVQAPGAAAAQGRGLVLVQPAARAQDGGASRQGTAPRSASSLIDPDLAEQHFGEWQGLTYAEIAEKPGNSHLFWLGAAGIPAAGRRELHRPARPHGAQHRSADRRASRPRHRGDGAWRHDPRRAGACLRLHPEAAVRFEIDNVSITLIEHFEQADPAHAWRVAFTNYMPRELVIAHGGSAGMKSQTGRARRRAGGLLERRRRRRSGSPPTSASSAASPDFGEIALAAADAAARRAGASTSAAAPAARRPTLAAGGRRSPGMCWASTSPRRWSRPRARIGWTTRPSWSATPPTHPFEAGVVRSRLLALRRHVLRRSGGGVPQHPAGAEAHGPAGLHRAGARRRRIPGARCRCARPSPSCRRMPRPGPEDPGQFSFGDRARVERILSEAGFQRLRLEPSTGRSGWDPASPTCWQAPAASVRWRAPSPDAEPAADREGQSGHRRGSEPHEGPDGVRLPGACWLVHAREPSGDLMEHIPTFPLPPVSWCWAARARARARMPRSL